MRRKKLKHRKQNKTHKLSNSYLRFTVVALIAIAVIIAIVVLKHRQFKPSYAATPVPYTLYESCVAIASPSCLGRLDQMAAGGFKYVINYDQLSNSIADEITYADHANSLGMKVIWAMQDPTWWKGNTATLYSTLASSLGGASSSTDLAQKFVSQVKNHPGTWGYYVGDETIAADHGIMKAYSDSVHAADPAHPRLFISAEDCATVGSNLKPFADVAEVIGSDFYPWPRTDCPAAQSITSIAQSVQQIANTNSKQSAYVVQAFSWAQYNESWVCTPFPSCSTFPTVSQMQQEKDLVMANMQPSIVLWYSFFDIWNTDQYNKIPAPRKTQQEYWNDVVSAAGVGSSAPTATPTVGVGSSAPTSTPTTVPTTVPSATPTRVPTATPTVAVPTPTSPVTTPITLGYPTIGRSVDAADGNQYTAIKVNNPNSNKKATEIGIYVGRVPSGGTKVTGAIYADNNGKPGNLIWGGGLINVTKKGWARESIPGMPLNPGVYWIGFNTTKYSTGFNFSTVSGASTYQEWWDTTVGTWPQVAPAPSSGIQADTQYSIYLKIQ